MSYNRYNDPLASLFQRNPETNILDELNCFMLDYLRRLSVDEVKRRILYFESLDVLSLTDDQLKHEFLNVISASFGKALVAVSVKITDKIDEGGLFCRARKLDISKH